MTRQRPSSTEPSAQETRASLLRAVPPVDECLRALASSPHARGVSRAYLKKVVQHAADNLRAEIAAAGPARSVGDRRAMLAEIVRHAESSLIADEPAMKPLVNASGVLLHTNLGRAVLAEAAIEAVEQAARSAVNLEFDLQTGERGDRDALVETELCALTGAEAATVVNNNAAAVLLVLNTLALGREVVVSRGELIEIGGSFRIPDVMLRSGARLHEVGTTNRTHRADYRNAIGPDTALLMKVHPSNYQVVGFTSEVPLEDLSALGREYGVDVVEDLGAGALLDLTQFGLPREPVVADRIAAGAALVTFSGDKLLGGPQAGLIVGRRELVAKLKANPLKRALRCDKLTLAALAATLRIYLRSDEISDAVPTLRLMGRKPAELRAVAVQAAQIITERLEAGFKVEITEAASQVGSGSLPAESLPSVAVTITHPDISANAIAARFRRARIIGRVSENAFHLDMRTVEDAAVFAVDLKS